MNGPRRYLAKHLATDGGVPLYGYGCRTPDESQVGRSLMHYLGMQGGMPLYGFSRCEFPRSHDDEQC